MKQTLAFIMATAMLACTLSMTTFAATEIEYPVDDISSRAYVTDDEGDLYLTSDTDKVSYGKTAYFPLLSDGSGALKTKYDAWQAAEKDVKTAEATLKEKQETYNDYNGALTSYDTAEQAYNAAQQRLDDYDEDYERLDGLVKAAQNALAPVETDFNTKEPVYFTKKGVYEEKKLAWESAGSLDSGPEKTAMDDAKIAMDAVFAPNTYANAKAEVEALQGALATAQSNLDALGSKTALETDKDSKYTTKEARGNNLKTVTGKSSVELARQAVATALSEKGIAETTLTSKQGIRDEKKTAYDTAAKDQYIYVYEQDATKSIKISKKWEEGGSYVSDVDVVRKRVRSDINATGSMQYIYFLAIKIKSSTSTQDRDLFGTVTLKKSGSNGFEVSTDISLEIGYSSASDTDVGEGVIPKTPATFKKGDGFDEDDEFEFEFEADGDSYFMVDTRGQGSIVLGFDTEYDEDISDEYPDADLWFYNGNYASFNRVGDLFLSYPNDDGYVYEISKSGDLTRISPDYDEYEDAYRIRTRTLGRYVISDTRLSVTSRPSSSSSSSGSGTGTGTGTGGTGTAVVPTAPSTPSYTYTPPAASSSTAPPAQSSSEPEEEEEEEESEPEELEDEDDDIVEVVVDDQEAEGPEEKSGIPAWVWAMIIVGLAAVPVAIGVVYYLHSRPLRRDFFNKGDDEYDDDYDDDDEE